VDFTLEVERSLRVLDGAVAVFDGVAGVEPQTETVWRQADKYGVPRMCFLNKMDRTGANFYFCVDTIVELLGSTPAVLQLPIGSEGDFAGVVDLVTMEAVVWLGEDLGASYDRIPLKEAIGTVDFVDQELYDSAVNYRETLVELAVEQDEEVLMEYLEGNEPDVATLKRCIRIGTLASKFVPVLTGTAFKNKGVQPLLDAGERERERVSVSVSVRERKPLGKTRRECHRFVSLCLFVCVCLISYSFNSIYFTRFRFIRHSY